MRKYRLPLILVICVFGITAIGIGLSRQSDKQVSPENSESWEELTVKTVEAMKAAKPEDAEKFCKQAMKMLNEAGKGDIRLVKTYMLMGEVYRWEGKPDPAVDSYKQAILICEKVAGKDHPDMIIPLESMANFYCYTLMDYNKVIPLQERILSIIRKTPGTDNFQLAIRARNLADTYALSGLYPQAETLYKEALAVVEKMPVPNQSDQVEYLLSLSGLYQRWEKRELAESFAKRALSIRQTIQKNNSGPDPQLDVVVCLDALGKIYLDCHRAQEAELAYRQSVQILEKAGITNSSYMGSRLVGIATALHQQHKYAQAETYYLRALKIFEKSLGNNSPEIISVLEQYAGLMKEMDKSVIFESLLSRADSIRVENK